MVQFKLYIYGKLVSHRPWKYIRILAFRSVSTVQFPYFRNKLRRDESYDNCDSTIGIVIQPVCKLKPCPVVYYLFRATTLFSCRTRFIIGDDIKRGCTESLLHWKNQHFAEECNCSRNDDRIIVHTEMVVLETMVRRSTNYDFSKRVYRAVLMHDELKPT